MNTKQENVLDLVERIEDWEKLPANPLVTVQMATYNHENYIRQSLDSVLMQNVSFDYEILLKEDNSTDNTREIVLEYQKKHPNRFRLWLTKQNIYRQGIKLFLTHHARGQYIAKLEGDDYWTDPLKLQKQVEFLEKNPDYSMCCHASKLYYQDGSQETEIARSAEDDATFTIDYFFQPLSKNIFRTESVIHKAEYTQKIPEWFQKIIVGDYPLFLLLANHGKIYYMNQVMSVYRKHSGGVWTSNYKKPEYIEKYYLNTIKMYQYFDEYSNFIYHDQINKRISYRYYQMLQQVKNHKVLYKKFVWKYFWKIPIQKRSEVLNEIYVQPGKEIITEFLKIPYRIIRKIFRYITKIRKSSK
jgi:glycosyltransferase involved in cell wall biosynthesis